MVFYTFFFERELVEPNPQKKKKEALLRCMVGRPKTRVLTSGKLTCRAQNKAEAKRDLQLNCSKNQSKDFD